MGTDFYLAYIKPYAGIIIKICRAYTNNQDDFEDYYQEVCLQIWRSHERFEGLSDWSTWVYRVALNVCLTYLKQDKKRKLNQSLDNGIDDAAADNVADTVADTVAPLLISDTSAELKDLNFLYALIRKLSETDRALILLYLDELSYQQIAAITGTNSNNVGVRISRIKQRLSIMANQDEETE